MSQVIKFLIVAGINCCESKRVKKLHQKVTIWIPREVLSETHNEFSLTIFFTVKPIPVSAYCRLLPKFEQEFDRT